MKGVGRSKIKEKVSLTHYFLCFVCVFGEVEEIKEIRR